MPAYAEYRRTVRPRERVIALAAVVLVQLVLGFVLLSGLRVQVASSTQAVQRLIGITLPKLAPPPPPVVERKAARSPASAPKAEHAPLGGSPGPRPAHAPPSVTPVIAVQPTVAPSGGGSGTGPALGSGSGGGAGGQGYGASGGGGADLELISGDIGPRDYPRRLAKAGIGGTVKMRCTVAATGKVVRCVVIGSSGVPELDAITPRLIEQRFVYRPATDRYGRPVADDVEIDWTWD